MHATKTYRGSGGVASLIPTSAVDRREWPGSCFGQFYGEDHPQLQLRRVHGGSLSEKREMRLKLPRILLWAIQSTAHSLCPLCYLWSFYNLFIFMLTVDNPVHSSFIMPAVLSLVLL